MIKKYDVKQPVKICSRKLSCGRFLWAKTSRRYFKTANLPNMFQAIPTAVADSFGQKRVSLIVHHSIAIQKDADSFLRKGILHSSRNGLKHTQKVCVLRRGSFWKAEFHFYPAEVPQLKYNNNDLYTQCPLYHGSTLKSAILGVVNNSLF